jgi:nucleoside-diphosphate-sugar epimerase
MKTVFVMGEMGFLGDDLCTLLVNKGNRVIYVGND